MTTIGGISVDINVDTNNLKKGIENAGKIVTEFVKKYREIQVRATVETSSFQEVKNVFKSFNSTLSSVQKEYANLFTLFDRDMGGFAAKAKTRIHDIEEDIKGLLSVGSRMKKEIALPANLGQFQKAMYGAFQQKGTTAGGKQFKQVDDVIRSWSAPGILGKKESAEATTLWKDIVAKNSVGVRGQLNMLYSLFTEANQRIRAENEKLVNTGKIEERLAKLGTKIRTVRQEFRDWEQEQKTSFLRKEGGDIVKKDAAVNIRKLRDENILLTAAIKGNIEAEASRDKLYKNIEKIKAQGRKLGTRESRIIQEMRYDREMTAIKGETVSGKRGLSEYERAGIAAITDEVRVAKEAHKIKKDAITDEVRVAKEAHKFNQQQNAEDIRTSKEAHKIKQAMFAKTSAGIRAKIDEAEIPKVQKLRIEIDKLRQAEKEADTLGVSAKKIQIAQRNKLNQVLAISKNLTKAEIAEVQRLNVELAKKPPEGGFLSPQWLARRLIWFVQLRAAWGVYRGLGAVWQSMTEYQDQLARVMRVTDDEFKTQGQLVQETGDVMIEATKKHGASFQQVGETLYQLRSAGLSVVDSTAALDSALSLIIGTEGDVALTTRALSGIYNNFGDSIAKGGTATQKFERIAHVLAKTWGVNQAEMNELVDSFKYVAPVADTASLSFEDLSAMLGVLHNNMVKGTRAGQSLVNIITRLSHKPVSLKKMFGLEDFKPDQQFKFMEVMDEINKKMKTGKLSAFELDSVMQKFGMRATAPFIILIKKWDLVKKAVEDYNKGGNEAKRIENERMDSLRQQWRFTKQIGLSLLGDILSPVLEDLTDILKVWTNIFSVVKQVINAEKPEAGGISPLVTLMKGGKEDLVKKTLDKMVKEGKTEAIGRLAEGTLALQNREEEKRKRYSLDLQASERLPETLRAAKKEELRQVEESLKGITSLTKLLESATNKKVTDLFLSTEEKAKVAGNLKKLGAEGEVTTDQQTGYESTKESRENEINRIFEERRGKEAIDAAFKVLDGLEAEIKTERDDLIAVKKRELVSLQQLNLTTKEVDSVLIGTNTDMGSIGEVISDASKQFGINANFIRAIIKQESGFNPKARSPVGAQGLMQLLPGTAEELGVTNPFDVRENIMAGVKYIKQKLVEVKKEFGNIGSEEAAKLALASYNAGFGTVKKEQGIPKIPETQNYVTAIMADFKKREKESSKEKLEEKIKQVEQGLVEMNRELGGRQLNQMLIGGEKPVEQTLLETNIQNNQTLLSAMKGTLTNKMGGITSSVAEDTDVYIKALKIRDTLTTNDVEKNKNLNELETQRKQNYNAINTQIEKMASRVKETLDLSSQEIQNKREQLYVGGLTLQEVLQAKDYSFEIYKNTLNQISADREALNLKRGISLTEKEETEEKLKQAEATAKSVLDENLRKDTRERYATYTREITDEYEKQKAILAEQKTIDEISIVSKDKLLDYDEASLLYEQGRLETLIQAERLADPTQKDTLKLNDLLKQQKDVTVQLLHIDENRKRVLDGIYDASQKIKQIYVDNTFQSALSDMLTTGFNTSTSGLANIFQDVTGGFQEQRQEIANLNGSLETLRAEKQALKAQPLLTEEDTVRLKEINKETAQLKDQISNLEDPLRQTGDMFKSWAKDIVDSMRKVINEWLAMQVVMGLIKAVGGSVGTVGGSAGVDVGGEYVSTLMPSSALGYSLPSRATGGILPHIESFRAFSSGGLTGRPTLALLGDNRSGREIVIPEENIQQNNVSGYTRNRKEEQPINVINVVTQDDIAGAMTSKAGSRVIINTIGRDMNLGKSMARQYSM